MSLSTIGGFQRLRDAKSPPGSVLGGAAFPEDKARLEKILAEESDGEHDDGDNDDDASIEAEATRRAMLPSERATTREALLSLLDDDDDDGRDENFDSASAAAAYAEKLRKPSPTSARAKLEELLGDESDEDYEVIDGNEARRHRQALLSNRSEIEKVKLEMAQAASAAQTAAKAVAVASYAKASDLARGFNSRMLRAVPASWKPPADPANPADREENPLDEDGDDFSDAGEGDLDDDLVVDAVAPTPAPPLDYSEEPEEPQAAAVVVDERDDDDERAAAPAAAKDDDDEEDGDEDEDAAAAEEADDDASYEDQDEVKVVKIKKKLKKATKLGSKLKAVVAKREKPLSPPNPLIPTQLPEPQEDADEGTLPRAPSKATTSGSGGDDVDELRRKLALLQAHSGINDEDLEWKLAETSTADPYGLAVMEREKREAEYDRLMWDQSKLNAVVRIADDRRVTDALRALATAADQATADRLDAADKEAKRKQAEKDAKRKDAAPSSSNHAAMEEEEAAATATAPTAAAAGENEPSSSKPPPPPSEEEKTTKPPLAAALGAAFASRGRGAGLAAALAGRGSPAARGGGGGGLMAAIAAGRGRGGRGGGRLGLGGAPPPGGGGLGLRKRKKTVGQALEALKQVRDKSKADVAKLPVQLPDFEVVDAAVGGVVETCSKPKPTFDDLVADAELDAELDAALLRRQKEKQQQRQRREDDDEEEHEQEQDDDEQEESALREEVREEVLRKRRVESENVRDAEIKATCEAAISELSSTVSAAKRSLEGIGRDLLETEDELERWRKRESEAPNRAASLAREEEDWSRREARDNAIALAMMRTLVPPDVGQETAESLRLRAAKTVAAAARKHKEKQSTSAAAAAEDTSSSNPPPQVADLEKKEAKRAYQLAAAWGGIYTFELAQRIKFAKPLHWVQAHPEDVACANFLAGAGADSFRNLGDYDVVELRAIYASCPARFDLDGTGAKAAWRAALVDRLRQLTSRDRGEVVNAGWDGPNNRRKTTRLPPLEAKLKRHAAYCFPSAGELEARTKKHLEARKRLDDRRTRVETLEKQLADAKSERDAAFADARSEYLQQRYGKAMLKDLAKEADETYKRVLGELGNDVSGARADLKRAASAVANASPSDAEHSQLRKLIEKHKLHQPNPAADAADCRRLARKALERHHQTSFFSPNNNNNPDHGDIDDDDDEGLWPLSRCTFDDDENRGRLIRGPFDPWPDIKRAAKSVVKKLTDAEEAEQRRREVAAAVSSSADPSKDGLGPAAARRKALEALSSKSTADTRRSAGISRGGSSSSLVGGAGPPPAKDLEPVAPKSKRLSRLLQEQQRNHPAPAPAAVEHTDDNR